MDTSTLADVVRALRALAPRKRRVAKHRQRSPAWWRARVGPLTGDPALAEAVAALSPTARTIVEAKYYANMKPKEIGDALGVSRTQVNILERRALEALRRTLEEAA